MLCVEAYIPFYHLSSPLILFQPYPDEPTSVIAGHGVLPVTAHLARMETCHFISPIHIGEVAQVQEHDPFNRTLS